MRKLAAVLLALASATCVAPALACTPGPNWTPETQRAEEDRALMEADVFYRGTIEDLVDDPAADEGGAPMLSIRRSRILWGEGAPLLLVVPNLGGSCALPNLNDVIYDQGVNEGGGDLVKPGWGVTVIGRREDLSGSLNHVFILVDGAKDTQRIVTRFQQLRLGR